MDRLTTYSKETTNENCVCCTHFLGFECHGAEQLLDEIPAADVAPVVRCKDCKHEFGGSCILCGFQKRKPEDFCSYGERKETE